MSRAVLIAAAVLTGAGAPPLAMHRPPHPPAASTLPAPHLAGDAGRLGRLYSGTPTDVTTYHYDQGRTGWNPTETDLTPASVASGKFGLLASLAVDGNVFAEPLLVSGFGFPDGSVHDVLIVATGHDSVYAFDAQSYAPLWQVSLGTPQASSDVGCGDVQPEYGISATPVIVRTAANKAAIYVVSATEPGPGQFQSQLHMLNLATGAALRPAVTIAPSAVLSDGTTVRYDAQNQWSRAGLAYNNGTIYVPVGSHCDNNSHGITGWLLSYDTRLNAKDAFHTVTTHGGTELASIWMSGFAPAIDPAGNVFAVTGNGDFTRQKDWGESVLKLPASLSQVTSAFTPSSNQTLNRFDTDFGSGGVMLIPTLSSTPPLAVALGKSSTLYLLNQQKLGGVQTGDAGALQAQNAGGHGLRGGPAYYNGPAGPTVFTQTDGDVVHAWAVTPGAAPKLVRTVSGTSAAGYGGSLPIVSSNGASPDTGVLWLIDRAAQPFSIEAYDAARLGAPIFSAQIGLWSNAGNGNPFLTPLEANGRVYAPGYQVVRVYGLTP